MTDEEKKIKLIERFREKHGDKFKYLHFTGFTGKKKVFMECPRHGEFSQIIQNHLRGDGCARCSHEDVAGKYHALSVEDFYRRAKEVHGDEYSFGEITDVRGNTKIPVYCKKHGYFYPTVSNFLNKATKCKKCKSEENGLKSRLTQEQVLQMCEENLADKGMSFEKTVYKGRKEKLTVTCERHGDIQVRIEFIQQGMYCPYCRKEDPTLPGGPSFYSTDLPSNLYLLFVVDDIEKKEYLKVGIAVDVYNRLFCFRRDAKDKGVTYHLMAVFAGAASYVRKKEKETLKSFPREVPSRKFSGYTECMPTNSMLEVAQNLIEDPRLTLVEVSETMNRLMNSTDGYKGKVL